MSNPEIDRSLMIGFVALMVAAIVICLFRLWLENTDSPERRRKRALESANS